MTLLQLIEALEAKALAIPDIRSCVRNDITRVNEERSIEYGVFGITQDTHTYSQSGQMTYTLNLFYIDRQVNSDANELEIQSHAIEVLKLILKAAYTEWPAAVGDARFSPFNHRFQDLCSGAYATVSFTFMEGYCPEV